MSRKVIEYFSVLALVAVVLLTSWAMFGGVTGNRESTTFPPPELAPLAAEESSAAQVAGAPVYDDQPVQIR